MLTGKNLAFRYKSLSYSVNNDLFKELELMNNISKEIKEFFKKISVNYIKKTTINIEDSIPETLAIKNDPLFNEIDWIKLESGKIQPPFVPNKVF